MRDSGHSSKEMLEKVFEKNVKSAGGCGGCGGCTFLGRLVRDLVQIKLQPPQPPQPPARFDTFFEPLFKHFPKTVSRILDKGPTKLASKSLPSANTLALSAPHSWAIYGSGTPYTVYRDAGTHAMHAVVGKVRELLFVQVVRGVVGRGRGSHGVVEGYRGPRQGTVPCGR